MYVGTRYSDVMWSCVRGTGAVHTTRLRTNEHFQYIVTQRYTLIKHAWATTVLAHKTHVRLKCLSNLGGIEIGLLALRQPMFYCLLSRSGY
jgi:hypothetical protein